MLQQKIDGIYERNKKKNNYGGEVIKT